MSLYPSAAEKDLTVFALTAAESLAEYPDAVLSRMAGPLGVVAVFNWLPSIAELRGWCSKEAAKQYQATQKADAIEHHRTRKALTAPILPDYEARLAVVARLRPMIDRIDAGVAPKAPGEPMEAPDAKLARLAREYAAAPVRLSACPGKQGEAA